MNNRVVGREIEMTRGEILFCDISVSFHCNLNTALLGHAGLFWNIRLWTRDFAWGILGFIWDSQDCFAYEELLIVLLLWQRW